MQVGMRHFHKQKNHYHCPIVNLDKLWALVGEEVRCTDSCCDASRCSSSSNRRSSCSSSLCAASVKSGLAVAERSMCVQQHLPCSTSHPELHKGYSSCIAATAATAVVEQAHMAQPAQANRV